MDLEGKVKGVNQTYLIVENGQRRVIPLKSFVHTARDPEYKTLITSHSRLIKMTPTTFYKTNICIFLF